MKKAIPHIPSQTLRTIKALVDAAEAAYAAEISKMSGVPVNMTTIVLARMQNSGYVKSWWPGPSDGKSVKSGPERMVYMLTPAGRQHCNRTLAEVQALARELASPVQ